MLTEKQEEILEAIWATNERGHFDRAAINNRCPIAVSDHDLDELIRLGLVHKDQGRLELNEIGKKLTEPIIRRHRLAEVLLTSVLDMKYADMEEVACQVEHSLAPEVEESICTLLGHPEICPDGKPIPKGRCCAAGSKKIDNAVVSLIDLKASESGRITYIKPTNHENFHQLISFGLHPGVVVTVHRRQPAFCIKFANTELAMDKDIARNIFVWRINGNPTQ
jgi:DtxR family Mn-dependent transcriptional regulator